MVPKPLFSRISCAYWKRATQFRNCARLAPKSFFQILSYKYTLATSFYFFIHFFWFKNYDRNRYIDISICMWDEGDHIIWCIPPSHKISFKENVVSRPCIYIQSWYASDIQHEYSKASKKKKKLTTLRRSMRKHVEKPTFPILFIVALRFQRLQCSHRIHIRKKKWFLIFVWIFFAA